jgi:hypothetical protein
LLRVVAGMQTGKRASKSQRNVKAKLPRKTKTRS